jgi:hypothetical protein
MSAQLYSIKDYFTIVFAAALCFPSDLLLDVGCYKEKFKGRKFSTVNTNTHKQNTIFSQIHPQAYFLNIR